MTTINGLEIGKGRPLIVSPIVGTDEDTILMEAKELAFNPYADLVEWRADYLKGKFDIEKMISISNKISKIMIGKPLIFSYHTVDEGGYGKIDNDAYEKLICNVSKETTAEMIDFEISKSKNPAQIIKEVHRHKKHVIGTSHNFKETPPEDELINNVLRIQDVGSDIIKIVVKPNNKKDVLTLMSISAKIESRVHCPMVMISLTPLGSVTRLCGEMFGSTMTYGVVKEASASGQISVERLSYVLNIVHKMMGGVDNE